MSLLIGLAKDCPLDIRNREELKTMLCVASLDLVRALDHEHIRFDNSDDRAMLHALLMTAMELIFDGQFGHLAVEQEVGHA